MKTNISMTPRTIIFLRLADSYEFFSTPSALYSEHTAEELGISRQSLNNYFSRLGDLPVKCYKNANCEIIKGYLKIKSTKVVGEE